MSFYKTGSASLTNGSPTVTLSGSLLVDSGVLNPGDIFMSTDAKIYEILSIQSNTGLTLTSNYLGSTLSGQAYQIVPIGLLPSALAQQVKSVLTSANTALASMVRYDIATMGLSGANQQNARTNIGALGAVDVGQGRLSKSVAGGTDVTLTATEASALIHEYTGVLTASINVIVPVAARMFVVKNSTTGAYTLTVKTPAGTGVAVAQGTTTILESDATNVVSAVTGFTNITASGTLNVSGLSTMGAITAAGAVTIGTDKISSLGSAMTLAVSSGTGCINYNTTAFYPATDNTKELGDASYRWSVVFAGTGSINTSDAREKTIVSTLSAAELTVAKQLAAEVGSFKFLEAVSSKGGASRFHIGMTVQRAMEIMQANDLDPMAYGFICYDKWEDSFVEHSAIEAVAATDTEPAVEYKAAWAEQTRKAGDRYGFRSDELLLFIARGFDARLAALESK